MFKGSRRRPAPVKPLTKETADPNAATAAASAFMRRDPSQSLSSAAAAAALRARPTTPTNVADVPSKRVHRRNSSVSSLTTRDAGGKGGLQRSPSVGSMIERTFRSPSPGRSPAPRNRDVPPVPSIPVAEQVTTTRATSLQTQPFRTASQKMKDGQQGSWFGAATARDVASARADSTLRFSATPPAPRPGSVSPSINFSYPRSRMLSPSGDPSPQSVMDQELVYDANSRRMVPRRELAAMSLSAGDFSDTSINKKRRQNISRNGSHISKGTVGRTKVTSYDGIQTSAPLALSEHTIDAPKVGDHGSESPPDAFTSAPPETMPTSTEQPFLAPDSEQVETEELRDQQTCQHEATGESQQHMRSQADRISRASESELKSGVGRARVQSESPMRSAHFAPPTDQGVVKHEPPPRSLSPRKSAMKLPNSVRGVSPVPSNDGSEASGFGLSQCNKDDAAMTRKKSVRVSWDDESTVVVGESTQLAEKESPITPSPQAKKPWHSITGSTKQDTSLLDDDETMSPRPALPLFGSVREKKAKVPDERPLVRPHDREWSVPQLSQMSAVRFPKGFVRTSDSVNGATPFQEPSSKNEANISKYREPLPTVVTAVGASGHDSDDTLSSDEELDIEHISELGGLSVTTKANGHPPNSDNSATSSKEAADEPTPAQSTGPTIMSLNLKMDDIEEEDEESDRDSVYSDAFEDLSQVRDNGFMSLDAALVTPPDTKPSTVTHESPPGSSYPMPSGTEPQDQFQASDDWEKAKAYWRSLSSDKRRQLEKEALEEAAEEGKLEGTQVIASGEKLRLQRDLGETPTLRFPQRAEADVSAPNSPDSRPWPEVKDEPSPDSRSSQGQRATIRKTMRPDTSPLHSANGGHGLKPQRRHGKPNVHTGAGGEMPKSLRSKTSSGKETIGFGRSSGPGSRPASSYDPLTLGEPDQDHRRNYSADDPVLQSIAMGPSFRRRGSDSSESSFTRARISADRHHGHGFPMSMRGSMRLQDSPDGDKGSSRFSLRSMSPAGSAFRRNSVSSLPSSGPSVGNRMRQSLRRGSSHAGSPRTRMSGFARSAAKKSKTSRSSSRFEDSSDDECGRSSLFRSRFADSSDEDESALSKSKGRGLPKSLRNKSPELASDVADGARSRALENQTDNQDSNATPLEHTTSPRGLPRASHVSTLQRSGSGRGTLVAPSSPPTPTHGTSRHRLSRRGSFMSIIRRKKGASGKIARQMHESAARRDTRLERSTEQLATVRSNEASGWPLPDDGTNTGEGDGGDDNHDSLQQTAATSKPKASTPGGLSHVDSGGTPAQRHKKKKFGSLRKMFGLQD